MIWLPILAGAGVLAYIHRDVLFGSASWCYNRNICWLCDKAPECTEELRQVRALSANGSKAYRLDPVKTAAAYLNRSFIRPIYRSREFLVEHMEHFGKKSRVFVSFDDGTHMAFELEQPFFDCKCDIWIVTRYAYLDENPN